MNMTTPTPTTVTPDQLERANLRRSLAGPNGSWLRAALSQRTDVLELALDAAVLASALAKRASAQLAAEMREQDRQADRAFVRRVR